MFWLTVFSDAIEETEEINLSDGRSAVKVSREGLLTALKQAHLGKIGFTSRIEKTTDGNGKVIQEVLVYTKNVPCSEEKKARQQLEEHLPEDLFSRKLNEKADEDVKKAVTETHQGEWDAGIKIKLPKSGRKRFMFFRVSLSVFIG